MKRSEIAELAFKFNQFARPPRKEWEAVSDEAKLAGILQWLAMSHPRVEDRQKVAQQIFELLSKWDREAKRVLE